MSHEIMSGQGPRGLTDIVAADEARPGLGQQVINGIGGLLVLLITGLVIVLLVLWKSP